MRIRPAAQEGRSVQPKGSEGGGSVGGNRWSWRKGRERVGSGILGSFSIEAEDPSWDPTLAARHLFLPVNAVHRTGFHGFLDAVLRPAFRQDDLRFLLVLVEGEHLGTQCHTGLAARALLGIDEDASGHDDIAFVWGLPGPSAFFP